MTPIEALRLKLAQEVLGEHAWVETWIGNPAVVKLLDALAVARGEDPRDRYVCIACGTRFSHRDTPCPACGGDIVAR